MYFDTFTNNRKMISNETLIRIIGATQKLFVIS